MKNRYLIRLVLVLLILPMIEISMGCNKKITDEEIPLNPTSVTPVKGVRIAWDYSSLKRVAPDPSRSLSYCGYARLIELDNGDFLTVYETSDGNIELIRSTDGGEHWSSPSVIFTMKDNIAQCVPDIIELDDHSIVVGCNPRPRDAPQSGPTTSTKRFGIKIRKSEDRGYTWKPEKLIYEGGVLFGDGCWEPSFLQLPTGELQLYFSNEAIYTSSDEQNISVFRSFDRGDTWTSAPEIASFRAGKRDGMPIALFLKNGNEIIFSIEDNGFGEFQPSIIRSSLENDWKDGYVSVSSPMRSLVLNNSNPNTIYAGAPYIRQLQSGEVILSCQSTFGRSAQWDKASMIVVVGDSTARNFSKNTVPFNIPADKAGLWNSLSVLSDRSIVALTTTNAYSTNEATEVWMMKGYVIPEIKVDQGSLTIDGDKNEPVWNSSMPVFVGHSSRSQLRADVLCDDQYLYVCCDVKDLNLRTGLANIEDRSGVAFFMDPQNKSYESPGKGTYQFFLTADNKLSVREGNSGKWIPVQMTEVQFASKITKDGYVQELAIPWSAVGGKPDQGKRIGLDFCLHALNGTWYREAVSASNTDQPFSWLSAYR